MDLRQQATQLNEALKQSTNMWTDMRDYDGVSYPMRVLLTELCLLIGDRTPVFVAGYCKPVATGPNEVGLDIDCVVFTDRLFIRVGGPPEKGPRAVVVPRRSLTRLLVLEAPNLVLPKIDQPDRRPLQLELTFGETTLELPLRSYSNTQREAVFELLPSLLADLEVESAGDGLMTAPARG